MENFLKPNSLEEIIKHSKKEPVLVFNHSSTCPISAAAYSRVLEGLEAGLIKYPVYIVVVQENRELSNKIAEDLGVVHQSPQIILVKDGDAIYDASHNNIQIEDILKI